MPLKPVAPVLVGTSPTLIYDTGTNAATITVQNVGPYPITITDAAGTIDSIVLAAVSSDGTGGSWTGDKVNGKIYAKCTVAQTGTANTRILVDTDQ